MKRTKPTPVQAAKKKALIKQIVDKKLKTVTGGTTVSKMCWRPPHPPGIT
jgi:hypothetical protein